MSNNLSEGGIDPPATVGPVALNHLNGGAARTAVGSALESTFSCVLQCRDHGLRERAIAEMHPQVRASPR